MKKVDELLTNSWDQEAIASAKSLKGPIFVVGAAGFIGTNLYYALSQVRDDVFAVSRGATGSWRLSLAEPSKLIDLDILNPEAVQTVVNQHRPQTVFNLSAYGAYSQQSDPVKIHATNYLGTLNLITALSEYGCEAFIQAGSSSEYGLNAAGPTESDELKPNSDYAVSKIGSAFLLKYYGVLKSFPCVNLRLYSVYGPWEEPTRLIPTLVDKGLGKTLPPFNDPKISRDYIFVDDCTRAFVLAALSACKTHPGASINIASGIKTTMSDLAQLSRELFKISDAPTYGGYEKRKWDLTEWYGNPALAEKVMSWQATTSLKKGLSLTADWQRGAQAMKDQLQPVDKLRRISLIFACYRDNQSIPILHERIDKVFKALPYEPEIIFVNDRSPVNDEEVIVELSKRDPRVIGITHTRNFGSQSAFLSGMGVATGDAVVLMDGDGQDPPEIIPQFIEKWEAGYEVVYGERVKREATFFMQVAYKLFYRVFQALSEVKIPRDAGDFSLIDKKVVRELLQLPERDVFLRGLRAWVGFNQTGVKYVRPERLFGRSTNNLQKNFWWAKKGIFSFSTRPLQYIQSAGFLVFGATLLLGLYYFIDYFISPPRNAQGITTIILLVLGIGSFQLISISIIGDYIGKITEEVKARPHYIRYRTIRHGHFEEPTSS